MKYAQFFILLLVCLGGVGCQESNIAIQQDYADREHEEMLAEASIAQMLDSASSAEATQTSVELSDIESFVDAFKETFNQDKQRAFSEFSYWEGVSEKDRKANMELWMETKDFIEGLDGKIRGNVGFLDYQEYASILQFLQVSNAELIVEPSHIIGATIVNKNDNMTRVNYPVCNLDGRFYICPAVSK